jgi:hypothetical protein
LQRSGNTDAPLKLIEISYREFTADITEGLALIDARLNTLDFNQPTQETMQELGKILSAKDSYIQHGDYYVELGESFSTGEVKSALHVPLVGADQKETQSRFQVVLSSPLFKASCAATAAGALTYCAFKLYNKDKAKEQQYSPIKWSLGAAAVVGVGTYVCAR